MRTMLLQEIQLPKLKEAFFMNIKGLSLRNIKDDLSIPNIAFGNLEHLELKWLPELERIFEGPTHHPNLQRLKVVKIVGCRKLETFFSPSIVQSLPQLENLEIAHCDELKTLFTELKNDPLTLSLPKLTSLRIEGCPRLEYVLPVTFAKADGHPQLEIHEIVECGERKTVFADQLENDDGGTKSNSPLCLPKLTSLLIWKSPRLKYVFPITFAKAYGYPQLEILSIFECGELKTVFADQLENDDGRTKSNNRFCLPKLTRVEIRKCPTLECVFPIRTGGGKEDDGVETYRINLPRLKDLSLGVVPNLRSFGPANYSVKAPSLDIQEEVPLSGLKEFLSYAKCLSLWKVMGHKNLVPDTDLDLRGLTSLWLENCEDLECLTDYRGENVAISGMFTNLVELVIRNSGLVALSRISVGVSPPEGSLINLETLTVEGCDKFISLYPVPPNLKKVRVSCCKNFKWEFGLDEHDQEPLLSKLEHLELRSLPELKCILHGPTKKITLQTLRVLKIEDCDGLESVFSSSLIPNLKLLKELFIRGCKNLKQLIESGDESNTLLLCFPALETLKIGNCRTLKYVLPLRISPPRLKVVKIYSCDELETVFTGELESSADEKGSNTLCCLPTLETLKIEKCPKLKYVLPLALSITILPSLKAVVIEECPLLSNFTIHQEDKQLQPKEFEVVVSSNSQLRERPSPNLGNLQQLFQPPRRHNFKSKLMTLTLGDLVWLKNIWKGPIQAVLLTNLTKLEVCGCNSLTYIFPVTVIRNLPNLSRLSIKKCEKLEQIIGSTDDMSASSSSQGVDQDDLGVIKNEKQILVIPRLEKLCLERLPSLVKLSPVGYHLLFPSLNSLTIEDCSKMITSFTKDSDYNVHAKTEAHQLEDRSPSDIDMEREWGRYKGQPPYVEDDEISAMK